MGEQEFRPVLVRETETFLDVSGLEGWTVGDFAIGQRVFIKRLFAGGSPLLRTIDRFRRWMHRQLQPTEREAVFLGRGSVAEPRRRGCGRYQRMSAGANGGRANEQ